MVPKRLILGMLTGPGYDISSFLRSHFINSSAKIIFSHETPLLRSLLLMSASKISSPNVIFALAAASGLAALSWEVIWQIKASLALGVSAWGTAITLAATMGGMSLGSYAMGVLLSHRIIREPTRLYGALECVIGLAGLSLEFAFRVVTDFDSKIYAISPSHAPLVYALAILTVLGMPSLCMGATLPVFGLVARRFRASLASLYGLNTLGAAVGVLLAAFVLIPELGINHTIYAIAGLNFVIGIIAFFWAPRTTIKALDDVNAVSQASPAITLGTAQTIVFVTGFATFVLEVSWFRSLTAAFNSTTSAFAIMLTVVLLALGIAAHAVPFFRRLDVSLGVLLGWAGSLVLIATPIIERFDVYPIFLAGKAFSLANDNDVLDFMIPSSGFFLVINRIIMTFYVIGPPVILMGVALPWILDEQYGSQRWGRLYALNALAAIAGSIGAAWLFLPLIGFVRTAWFAGTLVAVTGILVASRPKRMALGGFASLCLIVAVVFTSGAGVTRVQGHYFEGLSAKSSKILETYDGPEATVSAVEYDNGARALIVDGFMTAGQLGAVGRFHEHYMAWMGHLPMLLHPDPKNALVICFGTGQTLNAVRQENPESVDIVDINPRVLKLAHNFSANQDVLHDPRVKATVMDGRAFMRRTQKTYDVITLEPMPPRFAGVNALYDKEFYEFAYQKLTVDGVVAQWLPFHLVEPFDSASIVKTFIDVFPNALLWIDPPSKTGILLGSKDMSVALGSRWPGFARTTISRDMTENEVRAAVLLDTAALRKFGSHGVVINDDNQLLAYGKVVDLNAVNDTTANQRSLDFITRTTTP